MKGSIVQWCLSHPVERMVDDALLKNHPSYLNVAEIDTLLVGQGWSCSWHNNIYFYPVEQCGIVRRIQMAMVGNRTFNVLSELSWREPDGPGLSLLLLQCMTLALPATPSVMQTNHGTVSIEVVRVVMHAAHDCKTFTGHIIPYFAK